MAGESRATGRLRHGQTHNDSLEVRASVARLIAFCRGVSTNDRYASITFEDRAAENVAHIEDRLKEIASLKGSIPKIVGQINKIEDLTGLSLPGVSLPDFYGISSVIPSIGDITSAFDDLGLDLTSLDLDSPLSDYDMLDSAEGFGDVGTVFNTSVVEDLSTALGDSSDMSALEAEAALAGSQEDLPSSLPGGNEISESLSLTQEDL